MKKDAGICANDAKQNRKCCYRFRHKNCFWLNSWFINRIYSKCHDSWGMKKKVSIHRFICTVHPDIRWEFQLGKFNLTRDFFFLFTISFHLFEKKFGMRFELCSAAADGNENRWKVIKLTKVRHQKGKLVTDTARECGAINVPAVTLYRVNWPIQCARVRVCIEVSKIFIHQLSIVDWLKFRHQWRDTMRWFEWTKKADAVCIFSALLTLIKCQSKAKPFVSDLLVFSVVSI